MYINYNFFFNKVENEEKDSSTAETTSATTSGAFKDILTMSDNLLHSIMNEGDSSAKTNPSVADGNKKKKIHFNIRTRAILFILVFYLLQQIQEYNLNQI